MIKSRYINDIKIMAFHFSPDEDDWKKFLLFAQNAAPFDLKSKIVEVHVSIICAEHSNLFNISYVVALDAGKLIPKHEIEAIVNDNRT